MARLGLRQGQGRAAEGGVRSLSSCPRSASAVARSLAKPMDPRSPASRSDDRHSLTNGSRHAPRVLISDALSPAAVQIFKDRGIEVDFQPNLGKDKDKLAEIIGDYRRPRHPLGHQGHRRSCSSRRQSLKVIGRAGIGVDNVDIPAATAQRHHRDEHAVRQFDHHRRARHRADVRAGAPDPAGRRLDPGRQVGEEPLHGRRDHRQDARHHRLRQYRLDRRRPRASA